MSKVQLIDESVRYVLASLEWDGDMAKITAGQLDRKTYVKVNDVLEACGGKWSRKLKAHEFVGDARDQIESVIDIGSFVRIADLRQQYGEFETPDSLADRAVRRLFLDKGPQEILEPSAGSGRLIKAIRRARESSGVVDDITAFEIQHKRHDDLMALCDKVLIGDFLSIGCVEGDGHPTYSRVIMNPPFAKQADIDHVLHAYSFLKPGGLLVAIMSSGWTFRTNKKSLDFQSLVERRGDWELNPSASFACEGTNVETVMIRLRRSKSPGQ